jgi:basic amino acid/polyamine antiporter, APA family
MKSDFAGIQTDAAPELARKLGLFDVTMLVMGSVIGAGIFVTPHDVARLVQSPALILLAWSVGGGITLAGGLVYAELTRRRPHVGGQYAFLREAYHPAVAFVYGWSLLWIIQSGGMASVAVVFGRYFLDLLQVLGHHLGSGALGQALQDLATAPYADRAMAALAIGILAVVNCAGVRAGSMTQNLFMLLKIGAILALVFCGLLLAHAAGVPETRATLSQPSPTDKGVALAFAAALVPVLFSYGGAHTTTFMAAEVRDAERTLPRGLVLGVIGIIALYLAINVACLRALGAPELARSKTPASDVMREAVGNAGALFISVGIVISALGFLSQASLTSPRVYFAMARHGLFFQGIARVHPRTQVPVMAILLQGAVAMIIACSGRFDQILKYVMSVEMTFFTLTSLSLFILRRRDAANPNAAGFRAWGHPVTTLVYALANLTLVATLFYEHPANSAIGIGIALAGLPVYCFWSWRNRSGSTGVSDDSGLPPE